MIKESYFTNPHKGKKIDIKGYFSCQSLYIVYKLKCPHIMCWKPGRKWRAGQKYSIYAPHSELPLARNLCNIPGWGLCLLIAFLDHTKGAIEIEIERSEMDCKSGYSSAEKPKCWFWYIFIHLMLCIDVLCFSFTEFFPCTSTRSNIHLFPFYVYCMDCNTLGAWLAAEEDGQLSLELCNLETH